MFYGNHMHASVAHYSGEMLRALAKQDVAGDVDHCPVQLRQWNHYDMHSSKSGKPVNVLLGIVV